MLGPFEIVETVNEEAGGIWLSAGAPLWQQQSHWDQAVEVVTRKVAYALWEMMNRPQHEDQRARDDRWHTAKAIVRRAVETVHRLAA
jgi:hypothetical protein